jgi:hypothetical protein
MTTETNKIEFSDIVSVVKRLTDILAEEVSLIKKMQLSKLHLLQDEKLKLLSVVENFKDTIQENPEILNSMNESTKDELKKTNLEFEQLIEEDGKQLVKARKVHGIVMEAIRKVLDEQRKNSMGYNQDGTVTDNNKKKKNSKLDTIYG